MSARIAKGDTVRILPQWCDPGDDELTWIAIEDEDGGRVRIAPLDSGLTIAPNYVVLTTMLEVTP